MEEKKNELVNDLVKEKTIDDAAGLRKHRGFMGGVIISLAIVWSLFQFYTSGFGLMPTLPQRSTTMVFAVVLIFLLYPARKKENLSTGVIIRDLVLALTAIVVFGYTFLNYQDISMRLGSPTTFEIVAGIIAVLLILEVTRRTVGWPLVIVAVTFLLYAYFGRSMPSILAHKGYSIQRIAEQMYLTIDGIFGIPIGVMTTYVYAFLLFGAFLEVTGGSRLFINLAYSLTGASRGGPAKSAVLASGMMGAISGSSLANAVTTGAFTIPLMKKVGYKADFAAGVEASASSGGQIMPPIMGAAAFIMVEMTGIPYITIIIAAILPALLYFLSLFIMVHFEATRLDIKKISKKELPSVKESLIEALPLVIPIATVIGLLLSGMSPLKAAFFATIVLVISTFPRKDTRLTKERLVEALVSAAKNALPVSAAMAACGMIGGAVTLTGLGMKVAQLILHLTSGNLLLTLLMTMLSCLILGMGLPTTATYIVLAPIATPALLQLGVPILVTHMFIFYYGVLTEVTPPVALTSFAAAALANSNGIKTALQGFKLSFAGFLIPIMFVYSQELLLQGGISGLIIPVATSIVGMVCLGASLTGYLITLSNWLERILMFIVAILFIHSNILTDLIGVLVFAAIIMKQFMKNKKVVNCDA